jgi:hypothetical protein
MLSAAWDPGKDGCCSGPTAGRAEGQSVEVEALSSEPIFPEHGSR